MKGVSFSFSGDPNSVLAILEHKLITVMPILLCLAIEAIDQPCHLFLFKHLFLFNSFSLHNPGSKIITVTNVKTCQQHRFWVLIWGLLLTHWVAYASPFLDWPLHSFSVKMKGLVCFPWSFTASAFCGLNNKQARGKDRFYEVPPSGCAPYCSSMFYKVFLGLLWAALERFWLIYHIVPSWLITKGEVNGGGGREKVGNRTNIYFEAHIQ